MDAVTLALLKALGGGSGGSGLPSTDSASAGDVLSLDSNKDPQWATPSGGGGVLLVHDVEGTLDKTWAEINMAAQTGPVILYDAPSVSYLVAVADGGEGEYLAAFFGSLGASVDVYTTNSESGYPAAQ